MEIEAFKPKARFSNVVDDYNKYRPDYPKHIIDILKMNCDLKKDSVIADIGSGTGIFTKMVLDNGNAVYGVEPNDNMRRKSEEILTGYNNFTPLKGDAEETTLETNSIDFITVAQAFHWFDTDIAIPEFYRVLKDSGFIVLIWNERITNENELMKGYDTLLRKYCKDYKATDHKHFKYERLKELFSGKSITLYMVENSQTMDIDAFIGRLKSCSYCPLPDQKVYKPLMEAMEQMFNTYQKDNQLTFEYETFLYVISNK